VPLAIPIVILLALLVSMGYAATARSVAGGFASWMPGWLKKAAFFALPLADQVIRLTKYLTHELGTHFASIESQGVKWFHDLAHYVDVVGYWSLYWPVGLFHEVVHLTTVTIPRMIHAKTAPIQRQADAAEAQAKAAAGAAHSFPKVAKGNSRVTDITVIKRVAMPHAGEWDWIHEHFGDIQKTVAAAATAGATVALPHAHAFPVPFGLTIRGLKRRLRSLEYFTAATGAAVLVARAIGGVSPRCVKKGPIGKIARALCGLPTNFLNDLLGIFADIWIVENICTLLPLLETGAEKVGKPLVAALTTAGAGLCGKNTAPGELKGPKASVPDLIFGVSASGV
jgi:hypothetical protein